MENTIAEGFSKKSNKLEAGKNIPLSSRAISVLEPCGVFYAETGRGNEVAGRRGFKVCDVVQCAN